MFTHLDDLSSMHVTEMNVYNVLLKFKLPVQVKKFLNNTSSFLVRWVIPNINAAPSGQML